MVLDQGQKIEKKRHYMMREGTSISAEVLPMKVFKAVVEILKLFLSKSKTAWLKIEKKRQYMMRELTSNSAEVLPMKVFKAVVEILKLLGRLVRDRIS